MHTIKSTLQISILTLMFSFSLFADPPAYDICENALVITPSLGTMCDNPINFSLEESTSSFPPSQCIPSFGFDDKDVWLTFTALTSNHTVQISGIDNNFYYYVSIFEANDCTEIDYANEIFCYEYFGEQIKFRDLIIGQQYYILVFSDLFFDSEILTACAYSFPEEPCENLFANSPLTCNGESNSISTINSPDFRIPEAKIADIDMSEDHLIEGNYAATWAGESSTIEIYSLGCYGPGSFLYQARPESCAAVAIDGELAAASFAWEDSILDRTGTVHAYCQSLTGDWSPCDTLIASDYQANMEYGRSIDIHTNYLVVGAPGKQLNGEWRVGQAYVYQWSGSEWIEQAKLNDPNGEAEAQFGGSVSIYDDYIAIGENSGGNQKIHPKVFVFKRSGVNWNLHQVIENCDGHPNDGFGVDIDIDGENMIIAAQTHKRDGYQDSGRVYHYRLENGLWVNKNIIEPSDDDVGVRFGNDIDMSGDKILVGCRWYSYDTPENNFRQGKAYLFTVIDDCVQETTQYIGEDETNAQLAGNVSINKDGIVLSTSSPEELQTYNFQEAFEPDNTTLNVLISNTERITCYTDPTTIIAGFEYDNLCGQPNGGRQIRIEGIDVQFNLTVCEEFPQNYQFVKIECLNTGLSFIHDDPIENTCDPVTLTDLSIANGIIQLEDLLEFRVSTIDVCTDFDCEIQVGDLNLIVNYQIENLSCGFATELPVNIKDNCLNSTQLFGGFDEFIWHSFTAMSDSLYFNLNTQYGPTVVSIYSGDCQNLNLLYSETTVPSNDGSFGENLIGSIGQLNIGETYLIKIQNDIDGCSSDICLQMVSPCERDFLVTKTIDQFEQVVNYNSITVEDTDITTGGYLFLQATDYIELRENTIVSPSAVLDIQMESCQEFICGDGFDDDGDGLDDMIDPDCN